MPEETPSPPMQPSQSEDPGAPPVGEPAPGQGSDEPLEVVACGETVTFELPSPADQEGGVFYQVDALGGEGDDVTVRATTCLEGTMVDTVLSLYDQAPTNRVPALATNDDDAGCKRDPHLSTASAVVPEGTTVYVQVTNKSAYGGTVALKVHCGVYNRATTGGHRYQ